MADKESFYTQIEQKIIAWAKETDDVRAVLIAGATERIVHPADDWSDLDVEIFTSAVSDHTADDLWLRQFGTVWTVITPEPEPDFAQLLVLFDKGYKVDFTFMPLTRLEDMVQKQTLTPSQQRGYRILIDKDDLAKTLPAPTPVPGGYTSPTEAEFVRVVNSFWYGAVYVARQIRRRNLWVVKYRDRDLKDLLLQMLTWHARTRHITLDTWHDGHFIHEWVDQDTLHEIEHIYGHYDARDSWRAHIATIQLFRRVARETAGALDFMYPAGLDDRITGFITQLFAGDH